VRRDVLDVDFVLDRMREALLLKDSHTPPV
jgi:hypothetical protein